MGTVETYQTYKLARKDLKKTEREAFFIISKITEDIKEQKHIL
jgi:diketogulonate reductase-like aldo/keto reductase